MTTTASLDQRTRTELEAAAFRTLVEHLRAHPEVQNIDLMNLAGFCRNCVEERIMRPTRGHTNLNKISRHWGCIWRLALRLLWSLQLFSSLE
jgi:hypothetical protein